MEQKIRRQGCSTCWPDAERYAAEIVKLEALGLVDPIHDSEKPLTFTTLKRVATGEYGGNDNLGRSESETVEILESRKYPGVFLVKNQKDYQETAIGAGRPDEVTEIRWSVVVGNKSHLPYNLKDTSRYEWTLSSKKR